MGNDGALKDRPRIVASSCAYSRTRPARVFKKFECSYMTGDKMYRLTLVTLLLLAVATAWAKEGAAIYQSQCAGCYGAQGQGKAGPKLAGTSLSEDDIVNVLTKRGQPKAPHKAAQGR